MDNEPDYLGLLEASRRADVDPETVRRWCDRLSLGQLVEGRWRITTADLNRVIEARRVLGRGAA
jgi:hypothetical protein